MIDNNIKIPQIIATALQAIILILALSMISGQADIYNALNGDTFNGIHVFPFPYVLDIVIRFLLCLSILLTMLFYKGEHRRTISVIFIVLAIIQSLISPSIHIATIASIGRHQDAHYVGAYSLLTSAIGQTINPFGLVSSALFYIACGRYGISVKEFDDFQMQNSMQNPTQY